MKLGSLTLKRRILLFYFMFGFLPLMTISYISYDTASDSIRQMTGRQMSQLMERVSQQTAASFHQAKDAIYQLAENPVIQLSFLQFSYGQRMETLKEKLSIYRANSETLDMIALFTPEGEPVLFSPADEKSLEGVLSADEITEAYKTNFSVKQHLSGERKQIIFFKRVYDYEDETVPLGVLVFVLPVSVFTGFVEHVDIADGIVKEVCTIDGIKVYRQEDPLAVQDYRFFKEYETLFKELGWKITLKIPEKALLKDILVLRNTSLLFSIFIGTIAFIAAILFVQRILTPVRQIIKGTKRFSSGDLDYRINMDYGKEMRMLADAFDNMAENLQKRQSELVQANKLASLGLMSAGIAHEIKNPLAAIKTSIQVLKRRVRREASQQLADGILQEADRLNKIVSDLLNFSKPGPANIVSCDLKQIISYCLSLMRKDIKDKNVTLVDNTSSAQVMVDPAQMQQVALNVLLNALSAVSRDTGIIELSTVKDGEGRWVLEVKDNGRGIPEDKLDKVFDPFFSMTVGGTGLGLSVVFTLLRQNNIEHHIESAESMGTCFRMTFRGSEIDEDSDS